MHPESKGELARFNESTRSSARPPRCGVIKSGDWYVTGDWHRPRDHSVHERVAASFRNLAPSPSGRRLTLPAGSGRMKRKRRSAAFVGGESSARKLQSWWRRYKQRAPVNPRDPISLEPVSSVTCSVRINEAGVIVLYDAKLLFDYFMTRNTLSLPVSRRTVLPVEAKRIERAATGENRDRLICLRTCAPGNKTDDFADAIAIGMDEVAAPLLQSELLIGLEWMPLVDSFVSDLDSFVSDWVVQLESQGDAALRSRLLTELTLVMRMCNTKFEQGCVDQGRRGSEDEDEAWLTSGRRQSLPPPAVCRMVSASVKQRLRFVTCVR